MTPCVGPPPYPPPFRGRRDTRFNRAAPARGLRVHFRLLPLSTIFIVDSTIKVVDGDGMAWKASSKPTQTEIEILGILWERGPSTVREVHERLGAERSIGYTGVLKLLQNMFAKGLVRRDQDERAHVYEACEPAQTKRQLLDDLMRRVFGGSASQLVMHLLQDEIASPEEIEEIRRMLAAHRRRSK